MNKGVLIFLVMAALGGCGAVPPEDDVDVDVDVEVEGDDELEGEMQKAPVAMGIVSVEELRLYIEQEKPETVAFIRYQQPFRWRGLNNYFALTEARTGPHLIEMSWECNELVSRDLLTDMVDKRSENRLIRAGVDTIRGCRIKRFYKLPQPEPVDASELETPASEPEAGDEGG